MNVRVPPQKSNPAPLIVAILALVAGLAACFIGLSAKPVTVIKKSDDSSQVASLAESIKTLQAGVAQLEKKIENLPKPTPPPPAVDTSKYDQGLEDARREIEQLKSSLATLSKKPKTETPAPPQNPPKLPPGVQQLGSIEELKKQLEQQGVPPEQIEQMLKKIRDLRGGGN